MPSFDVVLEPDLVELRNAVDQANKEIGTRFDFKGSSAQVELTTQGAKQRELALLADSDFQLEQVRELLLARLAKRGVDLRYLDLGGTPVTVKSGIDAEAGRRVQQALKASKLKVQGAVQGDTVRVTGAKRDDLQAAIALLRRELHELPLGFNNFRA